MNLSEKIKKLRKSKGMSQEELAEQLNVSRQAVSRWENGSALPDAQNSLQLSKQFGVTTDYLLNNDCKNNIDVPAVKINQVEPETPIADQDEISDKKLLPRKEWRAFLIVICCVALISVLVMGVVNRISDRQSPPSLETLGSFADAEETVPETTEALTEAPAKEQTVVIDAQPAAKQRGGTLLNDSENYAADWGEEGENAVNWPVFGSDLQRRQINTVTFVDTLSDANEYAWDVSWEKDRSVLAWAETRDGLCNLYIGAEGGVLAPNNCEYLFAGFENVTQITFGENFDTRNTVSFRNMLVGCKELEKLDLSGWDTSDAVDMFSLFSHCFRLKQLDLSGWDTSNVLDMSFMFNFCESLETLDLSGFCTSSVTNMCAMFNQCDSLKEVDFTGWDISSVTDVSFMFNGCFSLKQLDLFGMETSSLTNMSSLFFGCSSLKQLDLSGLDTSLVTDMSFLFTECKSLKQLDLSGLDTSLATDMSYLFTECKSLKQLDLSGFDTSKVENVDYMFYGTQAVRLKDLEQLDFSSVKSYESFMDGFDWQYLFEK